MAPIMTKNFCVHCFCIVCLLFSSHSGETKKALLHSLRDNERTLLKSMFFPECVARVPVSLWGSGGEAVFAESCVCARNRSQPSAVTP